MSDELIAEREKVVQLMAQLEKAKGDAGALRKYRDQYKALEAKMKTMMVEVETLKGENQKLAKNLDSTSVVLQDSKNYNQVLVGQKRAIVKNR
jgi:regulator of replication initiation timing